MRLPRPTKINQRVLGSAVVGLLAANAFAAAVIAGDAGGGLAAPLAAEAAGAPASATPQTVTLITTADGRRLLVDPSTPEGQRAIADARRQGGTTQDVSVPARTGSGPASTLPGGLDLGSLLGRLPAGGSLEVGNDVAEQLIKGTDTVTSILDGAKSTVDSVLDQGKTTVSSVLDQGKTTVSSVLEQGKTTASSVLDQGQTTVSSVLGGNSGTVTSVVGGTQSTVTSVVNQAPPASSLLGTIITTVSTVAQSVTPTTTAPPPPTTVPQPVCGLLAHC